MLVTHLSSSNYGPKTPAFGMASRMGGIWEAEPGPGEKAYTAKDGQERIESDAKKVAALKGLEARYNRALATLHSTPSGSSVEPSQALGTTALSGAQAQAIKAGATAYAKAEKQFNRAKKLLERYKERLARPENAVKD